MSSLIRIMDDIETPARGAWPIRRNDTVVATRSRGRRATHHGVTLGGMLFVDDSAADRHQISLDVTVELDIGVLAFHSDHIEPTAGGTWDVRGRLIGHGVLVPQQAELQYRGVFQLADRAAAWLTLRARIDLAAFGIARPRRRQPLEVVADLRADAPATQG